MPSLASFAFVATPRAHRQSPRPLILFLTRRSRVDQVSRSQAGTRSSYSSGSLSQRKIYVNRHVDTCSNVMGARARAERSEEGTWEEAWKLGYWYAVSDFAVFPGERVKGDRAERNAHLVMQRRRAYMYRRNTRATRTPSCLMNQNYSWRVGADRNRRREDIRVCLQ